jgi:hypothetical protein
VSEDVLVRFECHYEVIVSQCSYVGSVLGFPGPLVSEEGLIAATEVEDLSVVAAGFDGVLEIRTT